MTLCKEEARKRIVVYEIGESLLNEVDSWMIIL